MFTNPIHKRNVFSMVMNTFFDIFIKKAVIYSSGRLFDANFIYFKTHLPICIISNDDKLTYHNWRLPHVILCVIYNPKNTTLDKPQIIHSVKRKAT